MFMMIISPLERNTEKKHYGGAVGFRTIPYESYNEQRLFSYTEFTDWYLQWKSRVLSVRYI